MLPSKMIVIMQLILIAINSFHIVEGRSGLDLSVSSSKSNWDCLIGQYNISFVIARVYRSVGKVDEECANSLSMASTSGVTDLDVYIFPCISSSAYSLSHNISCPSAEGQVNEVLSYLSKNSIHIKHSNIMESNQHSQKVGIGRFWIDIEDEVPSKYFDNDSKVNELFLSELTTALQKHLIPIGIYTTKTYWTTIMGGSSEYSSYPLWYPRYDGVSNMDFFTPFAGWQSAAIKQLQGDAVTSCSVTVDFDYMED